jgi:hypothetical protein
VRGPGGDDVGGAGARFWRLLGMARAADSRRHEAGQKREGSRDDER